MMDKGSKRTLRDKLKRLFFTLSILVTIVGAVLFGGSIYLKSVINSPKYLAIADESIKEAGRYITLSEVTFKYGIILTGAGVFLIVVLIMLFKFVFKKKAL